MSSPFSRTPLLTLVKFWSNFSPCNIPLGFRFQGEGVPGGSRALSEATFLLLMDRTSDCIQSSRRCLSAGTWTCHMANQTGRSNARPAPVCAKSSKAIYRQCISTCSGLPKPPSIYSECFDFLGFSSTVLNLKCFPSPQKYQLWNQEGYIQALSKILAWNVLNCIPFLQKRTTPLPP